MQTLIRSFIFLFFILPIVPNLNAQIVLRDAKDSAIPVAIQAFMISAAVPGAEATATDVEAVLTGDLIYSRLFRVIPAEAFLEPKIVGPIETLNVGSWRQVGAQFVVRAKVGLEGNQVVLEGYLFNISTGKLDLKRTYKYNKSETDRIAHMFGDDIVEMITGKRGIFSTKIAFSYLPPGKRSREIWAMDFNGKNPRPLVQNGRPNLSAEWSVDGRFVYYTSASKTDWHLWKTDLNGRQSQLTTFKGSAISPVVMPNGKELVLSLSKDGNADLYLLDLEGKVKRRLTAKRGINIAASPSPDGSRLCFTSDRFGNVHIFVMDINSGEAERMTRVGTNNDACAWSPFDDVLLFSGMDVDREFDIFAMDSHGNNMERLTYDAKNNEAPTWSPDGRLIAFSSRRTGKNQLFIMKADGTGSSLIADLPGDALQPAWSPRLGYK